MAEKDTKKCCSFVAHVRASTSGLSLRAMRLSDTLCSLCLAHLSRCTHRQSYRCIPPLSRRSLSLTRAEYGGRRMQSAQRATSCAVSATLCGHLLLARVNQPAPANLFLMCDTVHYWCSDSARFCRSVSFRLIVLLLNLIP